MITLFIVTLYVVNYLLMLFVHKMEQLDGLTKSTETIVGRDCIASFTWLVFSPITTPITIIYYVGVFLDEVEGNKNLLTIKIFIEYIMNKIF